MPERGRFVFLDTPSQTQGEFAKLLDLIHHQNEGKLNWRKNFSVPQAAAMLKDEAGELITAIENDMPAVEVTSELGDIIYLAFHICSELGIDPRDAVEMKILRNSLKYPDVLNSVGEYEEGRQISREAWKGLGGDLLFYQMYLMFAGQEIEDREKKEEGANGHQPHPDFEESAVLYEKD